MITCIVLVPTPYSNDYYKDIPPKDLAAEFHKKLWEYGVVTEADLESDNDETVELSIEAHGMAEMKKMLYGLADELESMYYGEDYSSLYTNIKPEK